MLWQSCGNVRSDLTKPKYNVTITLCASWGGTDGAVDWKLSVRRTLECGDMELASKATSDDFLR